MNLYKFFITIVFLSSIAVISLPYWTGLETERQFHYFNQNLTNTLQIKPLNYHYERGWFQSQAHTTFTVTSAPQPVTAQTLMLTHTIYHGFQPLQPTVIHTTLQMENESILLMAETSVQMNGDGMSQFKVFPLIITETRDDTSRLHFQIAVAPQQELVKSMIEFKPTSGSLIGDLRIPYLQFNLLRGQLLLHDGQATAHLQRDSIHDLTTGEITFNINDLNTTGQELPTRWKTLQLTAQSTVVGDYLTLALQMGVKQLQIGREMYGNSHMTWELQRLHADTMSKVVDALQQMSYLPPEQWEWILTGLTMQYGMTLLQHAPQLDLIKLQWETLAGQFNAKAQLKIEEFDPKTLYSNTFIRAVNASLQVTGATTLFEQLLWLVQPPGLAVKTKQTLDNWVKQGWLRETPAHEYTTELQLRHGILEINEQRYNLLKH